jgi:hypothetical protein
MDGEAFDKLWRHYTDGKFALSKEKEDQCVYAQHFALWADALYQDEVRTPTTIGINQKMLLLTKKYFEWRAAVPKAHRDRVGERSHICIFHIFERTFHRLKVLELSLTPPMLFLPTPPPAPVVQAIAGITLGEVMGE